MSMEDPQMQLYNILCNPVEKIIGTDIQKSRINMSNYKSIIGNAFLKIQAIK